MMPMNASFENTILSLAMFQILRFYKGNVKWNVDPVPNSDSAQIFPL